MSTVELNVNVNVHIGGGSGSGLRRPQWFGDRSPAGEQEFGGRPHKGWSEGEDSSSEEAEESSSEEGEEYQGGKRPRPPRPETNGTR